MKNYDYNYFGRFTNFINTKIFNYMDKVFPEYDYTYGESFYKDCYNNNDPKEIINSLIDEFAEETDALSTLYSLCLNYADYDENADDDEDGSWEWVEENLINYAKEYIYSDHVSISDMFVFLLCKKDKDAMDMGRDLINFINAKMEMFWEENGLKEQYAEFVEFWNDDEDDEEDEEYEEEAA